MCSLFYDKLVIQLIHKFGGKSEIGNHRNFIFGCGIPRLLRSVFKSRYAGFRKRD